MLPAVAPTLILLITAVVINIGHAENRPHQQTVDLVNALKQGGYVFFFRHAATDPSQRDIDNKNFGDCSSQRNLNETGRIQSSMIGQAFKALDIPVDTVISSPYCRCRDTAVIAFDKVDISIDLASFIGESPAEQLRRVSALRQRLATPPPANKNTVLIAHKYMFQHASGILLREGEGAIFQPSNNGFTLLAQIPAENWDTVVKQYHAAQHAN